MRLENITSRFGLLSKLHNAARSYRQMLRSYLVLAKIHLRMAIPHTAKQHPLEQELIISLTSYTPRFETLHLTLECLLRQSIKPDRVIFWTNDIDMPNLPEKVKAMQNRGLEIRQTPRNCGPFNKIVHTLKEFPNAVIVTTDDDSYYQADFLENLVEKWGGNNHEVVCNMAVSITKDEQGNVTNYDSWKIITCPTQTRNDIVAIGCAGVLYPPGCFSSEVTDMDLYMELSPRADDLWLFWMARRHGTSYRRIDGHQWIVSWPSTQAVALKHDNHRSGNDIQASNLTKRFGFPSLNHA